MMNPTDIWPALVALGLALLTSNWVGRPDAHQHAVSRFQSIDGLRGYLAFGVFLHHGVIWNTYRGARAWMAPASSFYANLGKGSVALFFMITAFLFCSRLLAAKHRPISWRQLFVGRVFRLVPLYLVALAAMFLIVAVLTHFHLQVPLKSLFRQVLDWVGFTFTGNPDVNGLPDTRLIFAGVLWSLPYEWFFYLCLPVMGLAMGVRTPRKALAVTLCSLVLLITFRPKAAYLVAFLGGVAAAYVVRGQWLERFARSPWASMLAGAALLIAFTQFSDAFSLLSLLLLTVAFVLIAAGNDLAGLLSWRVSRIFGEPAYSIYLLHGLLLYVTFHFVLGGAVSAGLSATQHWLVLWALAPVVVLVSHLSFRFIESPGMAMAEPVTRWLAARRGAAATPKG